MNIFLNELKIFSRNNWWIYVLFIFILGLVYFTWRWNIVQITSLFLLNFVANIFIMAAIWNYSEKKNKIGAVYHFSWTSVFIVLWLYSLIFLGQSQYILRQIMFLLGAIKAFSYYNFEKDLKILNEKTFIILNLVLIFVYIKLFDFQVAWFLQALGFSFVTTWLVSIKDKFRYFWNLFWTFFIIVGSLIYVKFSYISWSLDGVSLWFSLLTLTALIYFLKLLPNYIKK